MLASVDVSFRRRNRFSGGKAQDVEIEHFTPPAVLGEHELVLTAMKKQKVAKRQAGSRARRAAKGDARAAEDVDGDEDTRRRYTAVAASACIVASIPAPVFRQLVLELGAGVRGSEQLMWQRWWCD